MPDRYSDVYGVNAHKGDNDIVFDFGPLTILEDNQDAAARGAATAGGRGSQDVAAAKSLGASGRKRR